MTETTQASPPPQAEIQRMHRIFTALLIIGVSGAGKTSLIATFADYLWETYDRILLLYSWDGGAIPTQIQKKIHQGLIRFWRVRTRSAPGLSLESLYFATKGYWPRQITPSTGETTPAIELVAPVTTRYELSTLDGRLLKIVPSASLIKPTLDPTTGQMLTVDKLMVKETVVRTKGFELVGGVAFDGLTSMANVVMDNQDYLRGHGLIGGEKSSFGGVVQSGQIKFGGNNRADVGFAQTRANQFVSNSLSIPYLLEGPVFTGLSTEGTDKGGLSVVGVDLPGQAALTQAPQWFGNICEADVVNDDQGLPHYALNLTKFTDPQGRLHLLKTSASPWGVPDKLIDPAKGAGQPFSEFNLGKVFKLLDLDLERALAEDPLPGAPGMPDQLVEYGEPARVEERLADPSSRSSAGGSPSPDTLSGRSGTVVPPTGQGPVGRPAAGRPRAAQPRQATSGAQVQPAGEPQVSQSQTAPASPPPPPGRPPMRAPGT